MSVDVALYLPSLMGNSTGGAEIVLIDLGRGFARRGWNVDLLVVDPAGPKALIDKASADLRVVHLATKHRSYRSLPALTSYLRRERPKVLLTFSFGTNSIAILSKIISGVPVKCVFKVSNNLSMNMIDRPFKYGRLELAGMHYLYRKAHKIVCVSHGVAEDLVDVLKLPEQSVHVIYNPLPLDIHAKAALPVDHPWFSTGGGPVILTIGRFETQKDYPTLLRAFAIIRQQRLARLLMLGEGSERDSLTKLAAELKISEDVDMPGFVLNPFAYMSRANVLVMSSIYEGLGNVIAQAMACGCPVVSTDCKSGPRELLENGKYGMLTPLRDPDALAQAILDTLDHPIDSAILRQRAEDFSFKKIVKEYLDVLDLPKHT